VEGLAGLLPFVLIAVVFWFLLIRPQRRRQQDLNRTQRALEVGDEVLLGAGIAGQVASLGDEYLQVLIAPGVEMKVARQAVIRVITPVERPTDVPDDQPPAADES